jgi:hypothetical protein
VTLANSCGNPWLWIWGIGRVLSLEKNFYRLPFTPPLSGCLIGPSTSTRKCPGTWRLPTRSTQPKRYSRSPEQHGHSVQIQRLKRPIMAKVWIPKLWASMIASIWTYGRLNSALGAWRSGHWNTCYADKVEIRQIIFRGRFLILSSFPKKEMNTKVRDNFVAHYLGTEFALFGSWTWEIRRRQGRTANQKNLDEAEFMGTKSSSLPRKISCARWITPQGSSRA